jgi:hypothetical protein
MRVWAILAESYSGVDDGVIANNVVIGGGSTPHGVDVPSGAAGAGGYVITDNAFRGFTVQGVDTGDLSAFQQGTIVADNFGATVPTVESGRRGSSQVSSSRPGPVVVRFHGSGA